MLLLTDRLIFDLHYVLSSTDRRSNAPTSTSHRFDSELDRLATEIGCNGGKEAGNALLSRETVQACLPASL